MKTMFLILFAILLLPIQICSAEKISVCDLSVEEIISRCNQILADENLPQTIEFYDIEAGDGLSIHTYQRNGSKINFAVNSNGKIEQITIVFRNDSDETSNVGFENTGMILFALDLSDSELDELFAGGNPTSVWCNASQRRIVMEGANDEEGFGFITLKAEDK